MSFSRKYSGVGSQWWKQINYQFLLMYTIRKTRHNTMQYSDVFEYSFRNTSYLPNLIRLKNIDIRTLEHCRVSRRRLSHHEIWRIQNAVSRNPVLQAGSQSVCEPFQGKISLIKALETHLTYFGKALSYQPLWLGLVQPNLNDLNDLNDLN